MDKKKITVLENTICVQNYARTLRRLRHEHGLTQVQVADYLGASRASYFRYEKGRLDLPTRHLICLCELYDVSSDEVLGLAAFPRVRTAAYAEDDSTHDMAETVLEGYTAIAADMLRPRRNIRRTLG